MSASVIPFLALFAAGVVALQLCPALPPQPLVLAIGGGFACAVIVQRRFASRWSRIIAIALCAALCGFAYAAARAELRLADALPPQWEGVDLRVVGVVDELPQPVERGARFTFAVERVVTDGAVVPNHVSLGWYAQRAKGDDDVAIPEVHAGERWMLTVRLKRPHGNVNPAGFDLEAWLLEHDLRATGYVRPDATNARVDAFAGRFCDYVQRARESIRGRILAALPNRPYAGVLVALAIGDQRAIPESQWLVFNRTGIAHLVSISGLHVTVFAALAGGLAFLVARRSVFITTRIPARKIAALVGALFAFAYVLLAGACGSALAVCGWGVQALRRSCGCGPSSSYCSGIRGRRLRPASGSRLARSVCCCSPAAAVCAPRTRRRGDSACGTCSPRARARNGS